MNILIELGIILAIAGSIYWAGDRNGAQRILTADAKEVSQAHEVENKAIEELKNAKLDRDKLVNQRLTIVHTVKDTSGCLDLDLRSINTDLVDSVRKSSGD